LAQNNHLKQALNTFFFLSRIKEEIIATVTKEKSFILFLVFCCCVKSMNAKKETFLFWATPRRKQVLLSIDVLFEGFFV
jgi:hypothetical protein